MSIYIYFYFCNINQSHSLTFNRIVCHSLTVSNSQVYSNDEFDLWPVYSGEQFRLSWPSCLKLAFHGHLQ